MPRGLRHHWCRSRFRGSGFRMTVPREVIFNILNSTDSHLSAEDIYHKVHRHYPGIGLTTVYRTLDLLSEMGLVRRFDFGDGRGRYELIMGPKGKVHHHHLLCTSCGRVIDYKEFLEDEKQLLGKTEKGLSRKYNFKITDHDITFMGLCEKCKGGD